MMLEVPDRLWHIWCEAESVYEASGAANAGSKPLNLEQIEAIRLRAVAAMTLLNEAKPVTP